ncbi:hypothetical protein BW721_05140 [Jeotgalibaca sp. PTS2502]|uniref:hypothetical protein n=1 Tax=Jeotgalibaca sp. PTS2502 TaxID=1903686 RepID=UPI000973DC84|nr:hypothetical protein [Jeotgalibaca sp. PTS2502]APZ49122.1 hypothetical protein BW721_05140 [Jeotgalibaca sp. PTS2502]
MKYKKSILLSILVLVVLIGGFFSWKIYQDKTREFIDVTDLNDITMVNQDGQLYIVGIADLSRFERVANYGAIQVGNSVYIYITKTKAIVRKNEVSENISNILISDEEIEPEKYYIVSGEGIEVKPTDNPRENYYDITKYSEIKELEEAK